MPGSQSVGALGQTAALRLRMLNFYLQRLIFVCVFTWSQSTDSFSIFSRPVETSTSPYCHYYCIRFGAYCQLPFFYRNYFFICITSMQDPHLESTDLRGIFTGHNNTQDHHSQCDTETESSQKIVGMVCKKQYKIDNRCHKPANI